VGLDLGTLPDGVEVVSDAVASRDRKMATQLRLAAESERRSGSPGYPPPGLLPWLLDQLRRSRPDLGAELGIPPGKR
jgi:hypothetical protein